jgi:cytochrome c oxidase cbb3-type subunit 3
MDAKWRYGSEPEQIFASIAQGRPNGMPAFGEHVPEDQIWQLVAYVRSLSGQLRIDVTPTRSDTLQSSKPPSRREKETPTHEQTPAEER